MNVGVFVSLVLMSMCHIGFAEVGDPERGKAVFLDRDLGHCVLCHQVSSLDVPFQGNIGPDLSNVGQRLPYEVLLEKIVDPSLSNPDTTMPAYHRTENLRQVLPEYRDRPILNRRELSDLVAYLQTLEGES